MRDRTEVVPELRIFCQNVNRNYGYMDTLLADLCDKYDLLFIQEPPWNYIRAAPSAHAVEGEAIVFFFFFKSSIYNAVRGRSPRLEYK